MRSWACGNGWTGNWPAQLAQQAGRWEWIYACHLIIEPFIYLPPTYTGHFGWQHDNRKAVLLWLTGGGGATSAAHHIRLLVSLTCGRDGDARSSKNATDSNDDDGGMWSGYVRAVACILGVSKMDTEETYIIINFAHNLLQIYSLCPFPIIFLSHFIIYFVLLVWRLPLATCSLRPTPSPAVYSQTQGVSYQLER